MPIPADARSEAEAALGQFCEEHSAPAGSEQPSYTYEIGANSALLIEQRPGFVKREEMISKPIAKFRYSPARSVWSLYWMDANERWHRVPGVPTDKNIRVLIQAVLSDATGVFWS